MTEITRQVSPALILVSPTINRVSPALILVSPCINRVSPTYQMGRSHVSNWSVRPIQWYSVCLQLDSMNKMRCITELLQSRAFKDKVYTVLCMTPSFSIFLIPCIMFSLSLSLSRLPPLPVSCSPSLSLSRPSGERERCNERPPLSERLSASHVQRNHNTQP